MCGSFKTLSVLKPQGMKVVGQLCMVRNSIGQGDKMLVSVVFIEFIYFSVNPIKSPTLLMS